MMLCLSFFCSFVTIPFTIAYNLLSGQIRALGNSKQPFYFLLASSFLNIFLDIVFILLLGMGVEGAGIATFSQPGFCVIIMLVVYQTTHDNPRTYR